MIDDPMIDEVNESGISEIFEVQFYGTGPIRISMLIRIESEDIDGQKFPEIYNFFDPNKQRMFQISPIAWRGTHTRITKLR